MAFLTGSQVYGTPTKESDVDLVILVSEDDLELLRNLCDSPAGPIRFGRLNLIALTTEAAYGCWETGTNNLIGRKPVTREEAVAEFTRQGVDRWKDGDGPSANPLEALIADVRTADLIEQTLGK